MNLAPPAPITEPAVAEPAQKVESAIAHAAPACEAAVAAPATPMEAASLYLIDCTKKSLTSALPPVSVKALRKTGIVFESYAGVLQLNRGMKRSFLNIRLPCLPRDRRSIPYGEVKKYIVLKDGICLVYLEQDAPSPLYALSLDEMDIVSEDSRWPFAESVSIDPVPPKNRNRNFSTIILKPKRDGSILYQFSFNIVETGKDVVKRFVDAVVHAPKVLLVLATTSSVSEEDEVINNKEI
ncbi:hypothetical protein MPSEU_000429600 [Mayamaea pseudoterrestris]|nr:hypothetical protein MPSEU_000429600 [Mayamaea pseudoterrestris]